MPEVGTPQCCLFRPAYTGAGRLPGRQVMLRVPCICHSDLISEDAQEAARLRAELARRSAELAAARRDAVVMMQRAQRAGALEPPPSPSATKLELIFSSAAAETCCLGVELAAVGGGQYLLVTVERSCSRPAVVHTARWCLGVTGAGQLQLLCKRDVCHLGCGVSQGVEFSGDEQQCKEKSLYVTVCRCQT